MLEAQHLSISIDRSAEDVYDFASKPENLPQWAEGLSRASVVKSGDEWVCDSPMGKIRVRFAEQNRFGVMDHVVTLPSGEKNQNPFRVIPNQDGSEVVFTLFRRYGMSDDELAADARQIKNDLSRLKMLLERQAEEKTSVRPGRSQSHPATSSRREESH